MVVKLGRIKEFYSQTAWAQILRTEHCPMFYYKNVLSK